MVGVMDRKKITIIIGCVAIVATIVAVVLHFTAGKQQEYTPSEKFAEAYNALEQFVEQPRETTTESPAQQPDTQVDIEKTIRIMHSLEIAQQHSNSFDELLLHIAKQDFRGVAPEVLEAKKKLFPVMEKLYSLQAELEQAGSPMGFLSAMTESVTSKNKMMNILSITTIEIGILNALDSAYDAYLEQKKLSASLTKELKAINRQYIKYIEEYSPIYHKYMEQWDALCLLKDKAFIDCYSDNYADALSTAEQILAKHPNNPDGLLLKSLALVSSVQKSATAQPLKIDIEQSSPATKPTAESSDGVIFTDPVSAEANRTLDKYIELYPGSSAPALLLKGMLHRQIGNSSRALGYFDQAAIEYPRQADQVKDILNAYYNRAHLSQSAEGLYLTNYYCSTMEGYGIFSPNFQKAALLIEQGQLEQGRQEIYKHFFRRGNQSARDGMLFDMQFCETHLPHSFQSLFLSSSYLDISYCPSSVFLGMGSQEDHIDVTLRNRSDSRLENVRVFLCMHYTGMYTDDYEIIKIAEDKNIIEPFTEATFDEVALEGGHKTSEITHIRAIVMTDNQIGWVDTPTMKLSKVLRRNDNQLAASEQAARNAQYLRGMDLDAPAIKSLIASEMRVNGKPLQMDPITRQTIEKEHKGFLDSTKEFFRQSLKLVSFGTTDTDKATLIEIPRILTLFSPVCTIHPISEGTNTIYCDKEVLDGGYIRATFPHAFEDNTTIPVCLYGNCIAFRINIHRTGDNYQLESIEAI